MSSISERIIKKRRELCLTQTDLAKKAGLKPPAISQYESGSRSPSYEALIKLSNALNVTTDYLISGKKIRTDSINDQATKMLLKIIDNLSAENKDMLLKFATSLSNLSNSYCDDTFPMLNEAVDYAEYILKNIYSNILPVDVYEIAKLLNIVIYTQDLNDEYEGLLINGKEKIIIINDNKKYPQRKNFTIAILIGHAVIPWHVNYQYKVRKNGASTLLTQDTQEIEAQNFAASLIVPRIHLDELVKTEPTIENLKEVASNKYDVSLFVMANRLVQYNRDAYSVIQSENWNIIKTFPGTRPLVEKIKPNSKASTFFQNPSQVEEIREGQVAAECWLLDAQPGEFIYEESIYNPLLGKVLTLLRIK